jgi:hypothetical protein
MIATLSRRATEMLRFPAGRHATPTIAHASTKRPRMSADRFVPEEVCVGGSEIPGVDAAGGIHRGCTATNAGSDVVWYGGWDSNPQALTGSRV